MKMKQTDRRLLLLLAGVLFNCSTNSGILSNGVTR